MKVWWLYVPQRNVETNLTAYLKPAVVERVYSD